MLVLRGVNRTDVVNTPWLLNFWIGLLAKSVEKTSTSVTNIGILLTNGQTKTSYPPKYVMKIPILVKALTIGLHHHTSRSEICNDLFRQARSSIIQSTNKKKSGVLSADGWLIGGQKATSKTNKKKTRNPKTTKLQNVWIHLKLKTLNHPAPNPTKPLQNLRSVGRLLVDDRSGIWMVGCWYLNG